MDNTGGFGMIVRQCPICGYLMSDIQIRFLKCPELILCPGRKCCNILEFEVAYVTAPETAESEER